MTDGVVFLEGAGSSTELFTPILGDELVARLGFDEAVLAAEAATLLVELVGGYAS